MRRGAAIAVAIVISAAIIAAGGFVLHQQGLLGALPGLPSSTPEPSASATPYLSPLTGRPSTAGRAVLAVKIDNVLPARPQTGLPDADVVYVEPVEGGLSRIMAIFASRLPDQVGPVRSARESDTELLAQFGHPGLAFSGANRRVLATIAAAPVTDLSQNKVPGAYHRSATRAAPHNLFASPAKLLSRATGVSTVSDIGFRFGALPSGLGVATKRQTVAYGASSTAFTWSAAGRRWQVSFDGRPATSSGGTRLAASTVVIQHTDITSSDLHDVLGNPTPYTHTVGSGKATVLRDGVAIASRWSRQSASGGTSFTTAAGANLTFAAGQVWVVYTS